MMATNQSGIQWRTQDKRDARGSSQGLMLRGVVVATYVIDDPHYPVPEVADPAAANPVCVYCDVLCYTAMPGMRWVPILKAMVLQDKGSIHNGRVWKPKAATMDITGNKFNVDGATNPAHYDGDHVLVGFIDGNRNQPVILGGIPHPSHNVGNLDRSKGHRNRLKVADGDPDFWKHHGTFFGVDTNGDWLVDTTFANDGTWDTEGNEPDPPTDGKGAQKALLPLAAEHRIEFFDMADPDSPASKAFQSLKKASYELSLDEAKAVLKVAAAALELLLDGATIKAEGKDATAKLTLGDGAKSALIAEAWSTFWDNSFKTWVTTHTHPTGVGPSGAPAEAPAFPAYSGSSATSSHVKFPDM
jgi:hypothetical protein